MTTFNELGLSPAVLKATLDMGFEEPTPIQAQTIPLLLTGRDVIGQAQTGTGKTAAFGIPLVEKIDKENEGIKGLVLTPTRELAMQVAEELNKIGQIKGIRALPIYGGQDINRQIRALKTKPGIIVGTPGRLMDHMNRRTIRLQQVEMVILDEADEMLNMGFIEDIETILADVPDTSQTLLFSATMPKAIQDLAGRFLNNPEHIKIEAKEVTVPTIEQYYLEVQDRQKFDVLCRLLDIQGPELAIIFARTKRRVDELYEALNKRGYSAEGIHGDLTQARRDSVMRRFKDGSIEILVATDVAARGLDISGVTHVYNFDLPQDPESYVHRIGRTGRAGKTGLATTFVTPREFGQFKLIERITKKKMTKQPVPTFTEALEGQQRIAVERLMQVVEKDEVVQYKELAGELLEQNDSVTLLAAALRLITKEPNTTPVKLSEEAGSRNARPTNRKPGDGRRKAEGNRGGRPGGKPGGRPNRPGGKRPKPAVKGGR